MPLDPLVARAFGPRGRSYTALQPPFFSVDRVGISAQKRRRYSHLCMRLRTCVVKCVFSKQSMQSNLWINSPRSFLRRSKAVAIVENLTKIYKKVNK